MGLLCAALLVIGAGGGAVLAGQAEADFNDLHPGAFRTTHVGEIRFDFTDPDPAAARRFLWVEDATP